MASPSRPKAAFFKWKYSHYYSFKEIKGTNVSVKCTLCPGVKYLSTSLSSNSNLMKHLATIHTSTKLVAKLPEGEREGDSGTAAKQKKPDFTPQAHSKPLTQTELNTLVAGML